MEVSEGMERKTLDAATKCADLNKPLLKKLIRTFKGPFVRTIFIAHASLAVYLLLKNKNFERVYYVLAAPIALLLIEGCAITLLQSSRDCRRYWPICATLYLASVIPIIWIIEFDAMNNVPTNRLLAMWTKLGIFLVLIAARWAVSILDMSSSELNILILDLLGHAPDSLNLLGSAHAKEGVAVDIGMPGYMSKEKQTLKLIMVLSVFTLSVYYFAIKCPAVDQKKKKIKKKLQDGQCKLPKTTDIKNINDDFFDIAGFFKRKPHPPSPPPPNVKYTAANNGEVNTEPNNTFINEGGWLVEETTTITRLTNGVVDKTDVYKRTFKESSNTGQINSHVEDVVQRDTKQVDSFVNVALEEDVPVKKESYRFKENNETTSDGSAAEAEIEENIYSKRTKVSSLKDEALKAEEVIGEQATSVVERIQVGVDEIASQVKDVSGDPLKFVSAATDDPEKFTNCLKDKAEDQASDLFPAVVDDARANPNSKKCMPYLEVFIQLIIALSLHSLPTFVARLIMVENYADIDEAHVFFLVKNGFEILVTTYRFIATLRSAKSVQDVARILEEGNRKQAAQNLKAEQKQSSGDKNKNLAKSDEDTLV